MSNIPPSPPNGFFGLLSAIMEMRAVCTRVCVHVRLCGVKAQVIKGADATKLGTCILSKLVQLMDRDECEC